MHETVAAWAPRALSVLRIYTGLLLLEHGTAKILGFPAVSSFANVQLGSLTGASWYLYFRQTERLSDDAARVRAGRLGLRDPADADGRAIWDAIRRVAQ